jgi:hypothetical protein
MAKWITFQQVPSIGKTEVWHVVANEGGHHLGTIKWYGSWRQYSFFPNGNTVFEKTCMHDILAKMEELMLKRRAQSLVP